jgi:hypothetical protein
MAIRPRSNCLVYYNVHFRNISPGLLIRNSTGTPSTLLRFKGTLSERLQTRPLGLPPLRIPFYFLPQTVPFFQGSHVFVSKKQQGPWPPPELKR